MPDSHLYDLILVAPPLTEAADFFATFFGALFFAGAFAM
jgi:hypothetical protein